MKVWYALIAFTAGFVVAQAWKFVAGLFAQRKQKERNSREVIGYLTRSGGMPSGHAASMTALSVYLGGYAGFDSAIFMLAVAVWAIVIYDAIHVRYAVGEQGKALNQLLKASGKPEVAIVEGHTVAQVMVGTVMGIIIGVGIFWLAGGKF